MERNGLRNVRTFITADAFLAAIVLVWGQLWATSEVPTRHYGLAWTYLTVLLALVALTIAGFQTLRTRDDEARSRVHYVAVALFIAALEMGILNVLQSLFTTSRLAAGGCGNPLDIEKPFLWYSLVFVIVIIVTCILGSSYLHKIESDRTKSCAGWRACWPWLANVVFVIAFGESVLCLYRSTLQTGWFWVPVIGFPIAVIGLTVFLLELLQVHLPAPKIEKFKRCFARRVKPGPK